MILFQFNRSSPTRHRRSAAASPPHAKRRRSRALPARGGSGRWRPAGQQRRRPSRPGGADHHQPAADPQARRVRPGVEGRPGRRESHQRLFCQVPQGEALKKKRKNTELCVRLLAGAASCEMTLISSLNNGHKAAPRQGSSTVIFPHSPR